MKQKLMLGTQHPTVDALIAWANFMEKKSEETARTDPGEASEYREEIRRARDIARDLSFVNSGLQSLEKKQDEVDRDRKHLQEQMQVLLKKASEFVKIPN